MNNNLEKSRMSNLLNRVVNDPMNQSLMKDYLNLEARPSVKKLVYQVEGQELSQTCLSDYVYTFDINGKPQKNIVLITASRLYLLSDTQKP